MIAIRARHDKYVTVLSFVISGGTFVIITGNQKRQNKKQ
ncbi:hypothetical protein STFR1_110022 [Bacillus vallismortis]